MRAATPQIGEPSLHLRVADNRYADVEGLGYHERRRRFRLQQVWNLGSHHPARSMAERSGAYGPEFYAAVGCNLAWGIVDDVMSVITSVADRGWAHRLVGAIGGANGAEAGEASVAEGAHQERGLPPRAVRSGPELGLTRRA